MRRLATAVLVIAIAVCVLAQAAPAEGGAELTQAGGARFPDRSFALTLPAGASLDPSQIRVRENGGPVSRLSVVPGKATGASGFGVVLLIDATETMRGGAVKGAMSAARAFAAHRNPQQPLGVITFNATANTLLPLTTDQSVIDSTLAGSPPLAARGTHINDAVVAALRLLKQAGVAAGSVLVLSDGADTGSLASADEVAALARPAGVRIFTVALRSRSFDPSVLKSLAAGAHGHYSETASAGDLAPIYDKLGSQLANQYLIRYRSLAGPDQAVRVDVELARLRLSASAEYVTPALASSPRSAAARKQAGFWGSAIAMIAISFTCALLLGLAVVVLLAARPRGGGLRKRIEEFVPVSLPDERKSWSATFTGNVLGSAERSLAQMKWWDSFKEELEIARIRMPAVQVALWTGAGTLIAIWFLYALSGSALVAAFGLAVPVGVRAFIKRKLDQQRKLFADQLADNLQVIASAMRAGHSFVGALAVAVDDAPEPARTELKRVVADEQLGVPLDDAFGVVVRRMQSQELEQVALVAALQRETGGNTAEVIDRVSELIRERHELRRMVRALTAQGRMARWVVSMLPVGLLLVISVINPEYMQPLYGTGAGRALLFVASLLVISGSLVIKRIVNIKV
jgi:tight adherence protein B